MLHGVLEVPVELELVGEDAKVLGPDLPEGRLRAGDRQGEPVNQQTGEPRACEVRGQADLLEPTCQG
jgi:hypothetical protein